MFIAFESIAKIAADMLDPVRRAGPGVRPEKETLRNLCKDGPTNADVEEES